MSVHSKFDNPQPVGVPKPPIVLRFQGVHPDNLGRFDMHDHRSGGDLSHVDLDASGLNEVLHCEPNWQERSRQKSLGQSTTTSVNGWRFCARRAEKLNAQLLSFKGKATLGVGVRVVPCARAF